MSKCGFAAAAPWTSSSCRILISWFFKYAYVLLEEVAHGVPRPPVMSIEMVNPVEQRPLGQLAIFYAVYLLADFVGGSLGSAVVILAIVLLPASIAVLGASRKFLQALNPVALLRVVRGLGALYVQVVLIVVVIVAALYWLTSLDMWFAFKLAAAQFALLAIFNVIGGALYEKRDVLDIDAVSSPEIDAERESEKRARNLARALDEIYAGIRVRKYAGILPALDEWFTDVEREQLRRDATQIMTAALSWEDVKALRPIANSLIARLQGARLAGEALDVLESAQFKDATFELDTPERTVQVAELAIAAGRRGIARRLLSTYPDLPTDRGAGRRIGELRTQIER